MEKSIADQAQQMIFIQGLLLAMPDLPKFYPQIKGVIDMLDKQVEDYLGDDEKMVVIVRKKGITRAIVLNPKITFTLNNKMGLEAEGKISPVLNNYEKNEYKNKLVESGPLQILKERYEKTVTPEETLNPPEISLDILDSLKNLPT